MQNTTFDKGFQKTMKLYRGDSLPRQVYVASGRDRGRTFADHFCGNGLMAKFGDRGMSTLLQGKDLLDIVLNHVGYDVSHHEEALADHSPLISFSKDPETAFNFSERTGKKDLEECFLEEATHFMWELEIELPSPSELGRYKFTYKADPVNCRMLIQEQLQRGLLREAVRGDTETIAKAIMNAAAMHTADSDERDHYAELIDVVTYVQTQDTSRREKRLVDNTLQRSSRDLEWLLYPKDPMLNGHGFSARFSMNRHLRVYRCFRVKS